MSLSKEADRSDSTIRAWARRAGIIFQVPLVMCLHYRLHMRMPQAGDIFKHSEYTFESCYITSYVRWSSPS